MREPNPLQAHFNFHPELCTGCGACVAACMDQHDDFSSPLRHLAQKERVYRGKCRVVWYSLACLHCEQPDCLRVCPKKCFSICPDTGVVQLNAETCVGCKACARACRFDAIRFAGDGRAVKCDGCQALLREGQTPRCAAACPRAAITIDDRPALRRETQAKLAKALQAL